MRGTWLNTATVAAGGGLGLLVGNLLPVEAQTIALHGLGLVTLGIGAKMLLGSRNLLVVAIAVAVGGVLGLLMGIDAGIGSLAEGARSALRQGEDGRFVEGVVTAFVLFCVGPMTLLGCLQDALEGKIELLSLKSTLDGISAFFLAAAMGAGVLLAAPMLLIFQGALTLAARPLKRIGEHEDALAELGGAGGAIMLATGFGLLGIAKLTPANYLPAIFLAPAIVEVSRRWTARRQTA